MTAIFVQWHGILDWSKRRSRCEREYPSGRVSLFRFEVFQSDPASCLQTVAGLFDRAKKSRIFFEPIFKPILFRFETDQDSGRLAVTRDNDLLRLGLAKIPRQIVLDLRERNLLHAGFANRASHESASDLVTIAKTSMVVSVTQ